MTAKKKQDVSEHPADLSKIGERWSGRRGPDGTTSLDKVGIPHGTGELPYDLPVWMEVSRVLGTFPATKDAPEARGLLGWIVDLSLFTLPSTRIQVKIFRDPPGYEIRLDSEVLVRNMIPRDDLPTGRAALDRQREVDTAFAESMELSIGDEVNETNEGIVVERVDDSEEEIVWDE